jgi:hypothetical protein
MPSESEASDIVRHLMNENYAAWKRDGRGQLAAASRKIDKLVLDKFRYSLWGKSKDELAADVFFKVLGAGVGMAFGAAAAAAGGAVIAGTVGTTAVIVVPLTFMAIAASASSSIAPSPRGRASSRTASVATGSG